MAEPSAMEVLAAVGRFLLFCLLVAYLYGGYLLWQGLWQDYRRGQ